MDYLDTKHMQIKTRENKQQTDNFCLILIRSVYPVRIPGRLGECCHVWTCAYLQTSVSFFILNV